MVNYIFNIYFSNPKIKSDTPFFVFKIPIKIFYRFELADTNNIVLVLTLMFINKFMYIISY